MSIINYLRLSRTDSDELSVITAKQGDNLGDVCQIEVYDNQTIVELNNFDDILFYANKPDKSSILFRLSDGNNNFVRNNNTLNLTFTDTLLTVHGTVECEISFYKGNEIKSTYNFNIYVFKSPGTYDNLNVSDLETIKNSVSKVVEAETTVTESIKSAKEAEINASASATASANSASSALSSANIATTKATEAVTSAESAALSATTATEKVNEASQFALNASESANSAKTSEANSKTSEDNSKTYADNASTSATSSLNSAKLSESWAIGGTNTRTGEDTDNSKYYAEQSSTYATNAKVSETNSKASETNSKISEDNAKTYASNASAYASDASTSASNAKVSETNAENFASLANTSADTATTEASEALASANSAATSATEAESFAYGNGTRENDNIDNAKYYYQQAKAISESFSGALRPMGTVAFNDLPSIDTVTAGDMYNISDEFITTSDFKEGSGLTIPMGSNIYKLPEGKWDILAGSPVTGVKGNAETIYRKGNVNITPENIGLGNVPNVSTNNQTPTYSDTTSFETLSSGEKLSVAFSKIKLAISNLISHIGNKSNPHDVTKTQVGLGNVDNTADSQKSVKYASTAGIADTLNSDMADLENIKSTFTEATVRENLVSEETLGTLFGKIKKWFSDLKPHVFKDLVTNTTTTTTGYGLDATVGKVLQGEIDTLSNKIDAEIPEWISGTVYDLNSFVFYNNKLYRFRGHTISTPTDFSINPEENTTDWIEQSLSLRLSDLSNADNIKTDKLVNSGSAGNTEYYSVNAYLSKLQKETDTLNNNLNVIGTVISGTDYITITKGTWNITANAKANDNNGSICGIVSDIGSSTSNSVPGYGFSAGVSISGIITTDSSKTIYFNTYSGGTSISEKSIKAVRIA